MGRPKGSKNKPRELSAEILQAAVDDPDTQVAAAVRETLSTRVTMTLTDADLAEARAKKEAHARAAQRFVRDEVSKQITQDLGHELTVPQVAPFDLSEAFQKVAERKAREAGYRKAVGLRKVNGEWVFEAINETPDQP